MNRYHWFVLIVAALGWLFDCLDQQLFNLARKPAMESLLASAGAAADPKAVDFYGGLSTCIFLAGWATGGLIFGVIGDRFGRAKTMMITILIYSLCTGLSALSWGFWDFAFYRFLTGLGVGGEFAVGVALVAEVMPERARPYALGLLQALSAVGNFGAALIGIGLGLAQQSFENGLIAGWEPWRWKFVIGALPAILALVIRAGLKEPERWQEMRRQAAQTGVALGGYRSLFADRRWRRNAIVGMLLACAGVIGLWGIGFFAIDLQRSVLKKTFEAQGLSGSDLAGRLTIWSGVASMMIQIGSFTGMMLAARICQKLGRRAFFAIFFVAAMVTTMIVFRYLDDISDFWWMLPMMGFAQLSLFAGYAIYFPELFPTRLRSTGTSFCYNVGRFVAASGPFLLGQLSSTVFAGSPEPMRPAGLVMCLVFLLGLAVLPFAPETKGRPLPED
ncbi:MAG TPA: MFS transporter [Planctomycetaceae bacterium]|nr:MFS transporter [Planctomycetaceae bacterium]